MEIEASVAKCAVQLLLSIYSVSDHYTGASPNRIVSLLPPYHTMCSYTTLFLDFYIICKKSGVEINCCPSSHWAGCTTRAQPFTLSLAKQCRWHLPTSCILLMQ